MLILRKRLPALLSGIGFFAALSVLGFNTIMETRAYGLEKGVHLPVRLRTAEGMKIGAPVLVQGVQKGVLSSLHYVQLDKDGRPVPWDADNGKDLLKKSYNNLSIPPARGQAVIAILDLEHPIPLYPNYKIITRNTTLISQKIIEIVPGSKDPARPNWRPLTLNLEETHVFQRSGRLPPEKNREEITRAGNAQDVLYLLSSLLGENREDIHTITSNLAAITRDINKGPGDVSLLLNKDTLHRRSNLLLVSMAVLLQEARELNEDLRESNASVNFLDVFIFRLLTLAAGG